MTDTDTQALEPAAAPAAVPPARAISTAQQALAGPSDGLDDLRRCWRIGQWLAASELERAPMEAEISTAALRVYYAQALGLPPMAAADLAVIHGKLFVGGDFRRSRDRFDPGILIGPGFERHSKYRNVFLFEARQHFRYITGCFVSIGNQNETFEMIRGEVMQGAIDCRRNIGFALIDGIASTAARTIGDGNLGKSIERVKRNGIGRECDISGLRMAGIGVLSNPLYCVLNGSGRNAFRDIKKIDRRNCRAVSIKRGLHQAKNQKNNNCSAEDGR